MNNTMEIRKTYSELVDEAIAMLNDDADLFCDMVDELDSWNGFADGFRCYGMYDLNELYGHMALTDFLGLIKNGDFDINDDYFCETIYGLESTDNKYEFYTDHVDETELFDNILENWGNLSFYGHEDFADLIGEIFAYEDEEEDE